MNIVIHPQYEYLTDFIHRLPAFFEKEGTTIYDGRNRIKVFQVDGLLLNVKRFRKPILINRLIYSLLRAPKAKRSYEYALRLREKGIDTPEPIAYILCEEKGLLSWSYFISFQMPETYHTLYEAGQGPIEENSELFRALGFRNLYGPSTSKGHLSQGLFAWQHLISPRAGRHTFFPDRH